MIDVVLVDDHDLVRSGIRLLLETSGEFRVLADLGTAMEAIEFCRNASPKVIIMDLSLPGLDGIDAMAELTRVSPGSRVIVLTAHDDDRSVIGAIRAGAAGYVLKRGRTEDLMSAIRLVSGGGVYLSPQVSHCLYECLQRDEPLLRGGSAVERLTNRELEVMRLVSRGLANKEVAQLLKLSPETVRSYRKSLMKKLGVRNVAGMTQIAVRSGIAANFEVPAAGAEPVD